ncbi:MAG: LacI family DNA-binding transcriptional regulator [Glycomyces artemisiae]|uniref:LacI family DNA-binding transcriptional regulator n=1 Tax=Glycomyces artemisiae TaxID=1076443 RepID=A0A2T0UDU6_9ACTN|nr:LacI family DNA-binding transcriptional regulator [Glycomyces artemisiae]NUQ88022.1 LacI family DNA-binding transcriptional regulator [Glycomyces artemisiae]PRY56028.1 LacI family transcriptional regulator [Glycomyces artemisiae]
MAKRVTIIDVAEAAGVSRQTVSRAMNDAWGISESTRRKVLEAADRLGYRPSRFARNLVTREKTHALGVMVASFGNPYYTDIAASLLAAAAERGWQIMLTAGESGVEEALSLLAPQVDVIVGHFGIADERLRDVCGGLPVVRMESEVPHDAERLPGFHSVGLDMQSGIQEAVKELRDRGARRFGMVESGHFQRYFGTYEPSARRRWYEEAVGEALSGVVIGDESISGGGRAFAELMERHPDTDAVLMFNDLMALGAVQSAHALGIDVPGRVRIVGVDGLSLGEAVDPPLTSIALDRDELARHVMDIVEILAGADFARIDPIERSVPSRLLWRGSA